MPNKYHILCILVVCILLYCFHLDVLYVNIMEARNFITAREMLNDDHWLLTTLNGLPRYAKPPLPSWITAFFAHYFGFEHVSILRLPAAIMGALMVLFQYALAYRITNNRSVALVSSLVLSTSYFVVFAARNGQWDIFTHAFMLGSIYYLFQLVYTSRKPYLYAILAAVFFGCSVLSKGLVSLYALWLPFLLSYAIVFRFKKLKSKIFPLVLFVILAALIAFSWYGYIYFFDYDTVMEAATKEATNWQHHNVRPFYYYWSFFVQSGTWTILALVGLLYPYLKNRVHYKKAYTFTLLWTLIALVLLSIIPEKKSRYVLPVLIPLACNTAFYLDYLFRQFALLKDKRETLPVYIHFGIIATIGLIFPVVGYFYLNDALDGLWVWFICLSITLMVISILMFQQLFRREIRNVFYLTILYVCAILSFGMPLAKTFTVNPHYKSFAMLPAWEQENQLTLYEFSHVTPELVWAYKTKMRVLFINDTLTYPKEHQFAVLVVEERMDRFKEAFKNYHIEKIERYDMNPKGPEDRSHKMRLWRDLYIVTTKKIGY